MSASITRAQLASYVDHTLLKPEAVPADVAALIKEGAALGVFSVCISPSFLPVKVPDGLAIATVCGFPSGKHHSAIKAAEAAKSIADGADEVDMVIDVGAAIAGDFRYVAADIAAVRAAVPNNRILKVIIESAALAAAPEGNDIIIAVCRAAEDEGADFVKTSTGFHPAGGASVRDVALMAWTVGGRLGVKASGGIRTAASALAMIEAGATRLGLSGTRAVLDELESGPTEGATGGDGY